MGRLSRRLGLGALGLLMLAGCLPASPHFASSTPTPSTAVWSEGPCDGNPNTQWRLAPAAPTLVTATPGQPGSGIITVNWHQGSRGRGALTGFVVTEQPGLTTFAIDAPDATSTTLTDLTPGTYTFTVTALGQCADATSTPTAPIRLHAARNLAALTATLSADARAAGGTIGISFIDLYAGGGSWSMNGSHLFIAASTYKLPILMFEAQGIAEGRINPNGTICYSPSDYEPGLGDVAWSGCYTRNFLAYRVAHYSNNTAAHMLVTDLGGGLNAYARAHGAQNPELYSPNYIDPSDLAALWQNEAEGKAGGAAAQAWLYPLLTHTDPSHEQGIPAGVPASARVVHKIGNYASGNNDAALITNGPSGAFVLVVMTDGLSQTNANALMRRLAGTVWAYEAT